MGESWRLKLEMEKRRFHSPTPTRNSNSVLLRRAARRSRELRFSPRPRPLRRRLTAVSRLCLSPVCRNVLRPFSRPVQWIAGNSTSNALRAGSASRTAGEGAFRLRQTSSASASQRWISVAATVFSAATTPAGMSARRWRSTGFRGSSARTSTWAMRSGRRIFASARTEWSAPPARASAR